MEWFTRCATQSEGNDLPSSGAGLFERTAHHVQR